MPRAGLGDANVPRDDSRAVALSQRIALARSALEGNIQRLEDSCSRLQATREQVITGRSRRERLYESAYARLEARLETMPVIEQAKGILMAQTGCTAEQAFDMLRRPRSVPM
jgi:ANTAR domain